MRYCIVQTVCGALAVSRQMLWCGVFGEDSNSRVAWVSIAPDSSWTRLLRSSMLRFTCPPRSVPYTSGLHLRVVGALQRLILIAGRIEIRACISRNRFAIQVHVKATYRLSWWSVLCLLLILTRLSTGGRGRGGQWLTTTIHGLIVFKEPAAIATIGRWRKESLEVNRGVT